MSAAFGTQAFQQSRHARRIYVGGFPPNYGDEEALKFFLNSVIAKGLGEQNDNSYVLSIYVNQKKCFAFVEMRAIELATACLELDGIIYKKVVLKVLRANEYKPELIPPSMVGPPITLDLSSFSFGTPSAALGGASEKNNSTQSHTLGGIANSASSETTAEDARLDAVIQFASLAYVVPDCISIVGYPFDDRAAHSFSPMPKDGSAQGTGQVSAAASTGAGSGGYTGLGCTQAAKKMRNMIRKYKFGLTQNPEYGVDIGQLKFVDVGDVQVGKTREETKYNLSAMVSDIAQKRAVPFVVGGGSECSYFTTLGVMSASEARVGLVVVSAQIDDTRILDDHRFVSYSVSGGQGGSEAGSPDHPHGSQLGTEVDSSPQQQQQQQGPYSPSHHCVADCGGRYVRFAAQGSQCTISQCSNVTQKGGHIVWLGKDIRNQSPQCSVLPAGSGASAVPMPSTLSAPHAHTLRLFREALRCAAGIPAVTPTIPSADAAAQSPGELEFSDTLSQVSPTQDPGNEFSAHQPLQLRTPAAAPTNTGGSPHGVVVSFDMGALQGSVRGSGYVTGSSSSATGLTVDEILDMAMIAGADANVMSLDISEFSPDAEDTRSNMLLPQLFYQFALGVASRPGSSKVGSRHVCSAAPGLEVEAKMGSFLLPDHGHFVPPRIQTERPAGEMSMASISRTPKYYQEISSGSMDGMVGGHNYSSASTAAGEAHSGKSTYTGISISSQQPYVEVDHRLSSMDAMDFPGPLSTGASSSGNDAGQGYRSMGKPSVGGYATSPSTQHAAMSGVYSNSSNFPENARNLYPSGVLNPRMTVSTAGDSNFMTSMMRTSPGNTPASQMRRPGLPGAAGSSPPAQYRPMNAPKLPSPTMGGGGLYGNAAPPRPPLPNAPQVPQHQHQQMYAQQALMLQQQQAYAQRNPGTASYRPSAHAPSFTPQQNAQQQQQQQGYQQRRYEADLQQLDPDLPSAFGRSNMYDRAPDAGRFPSSQPSHRAPGLPSPQLQQQQGNTPVFLSSDFLDITGERIPGAALGSGGSYLDRGQAPSGRLPSGNSTSELGGGLAGLQSSMSSSALNDVHAFDETLDLYEFRQSTRSAPGSNRPPSGGAQQQQQSALPLGGQRNSSSGNMYPSMYSASSSTYSNDSLSYSNASSSLNSELMAGLGGYGSTSSGNNGSFGSSLFGPQSGSAAPQQPNQHQQQQN